MVRIWAANDARCMFCGHNACPVPFGHLPYGYKLSVVTPTLFVHHLPSGLDSPGLASMGPLSFS